MMGEVSLETSPKNIMIQDMINSENSMNTTESTDTNIFKIRILYGNAHSLYLVFVPNKVNKNENKAALAFFIQLIQYLSLMFCSFNFAHILVDWISFIYPSDM